MGKTTIKTIQSKKGREKLAMLTAYDCPTARLADEAGCDMLLVGDSLGNVVLGYEDTTHVTMDDMIHHARAAARGVKNALLVADMPFLGCHTGLHEAVRNAGALISRGYASAVKLEGGGEICETVRAIVDAGIPVMGHLGLTPQSVNQLGGYGTQAKTADAAEKLFADARALEKAGAFALVLECIPHALAQKVTAACTIPTIGIGAGPACDGQVLVLHDMLGLSAGHTPSFVKRYADLNSAIDSSIRRYIDEVRKGVFPQ